MPCMLALEEVTRKDEGEDDDDEENHDEDDVQVHRGYSGGHHHFWERKLSKQKKNWNYKKTSPIQVWYQVTGEKEWFPSKFHHHFLQTVSCLDYNRTKLDKMTNVML